MEGFIAGLVHQNLNVVALSLSEEPIYTSWREHLLRQYGQQLLASWALRVRVRELAISFEHLGVGAVDPVVQNRASNDIIDGGFQRQIDRMPVKAGFGGVGFPVQR